MALEIRFGILVENIKRESSPGKMEELDYLVLSQVDGGKTTPTIRFDPNLVFTSLRDHL